MERQLSGWALDLDGVIWRGTETVPGSPEAVAQQVPAPVTGPDHPGQVEKRQAEAERDGVLPENHRGCGRAACHRGALNGHIHQREGRACEDHQCRAFPRGIDREGHAKLLSYHDPKARQERQRPV